MSRPLADLMRPNTIDDVVGQTTLLGENGLVRRMVDNKKLSNLILWGPPGCGKTTILEELYNLWDEFLESWPVDRVKKMTLKEYTEAGNPDAFTHWVEFRTKPLATISGTSSFIFGIYSRKDQSNKNNTKKKCWRKASFFLLIYSLTYE